MNNLSQVYTDKYRPDKKSDEICPKQESFADYVFNTWIGSPDDSIVNTFDHDLWNHYGNKIRTNNHLEGFHAKLNRFFRTAKPHIYKIINVIKRQEQITHIKYLRLQVNAKGSSLKEQLKNANIKNLTQQYELDDNFTLEDLMVKLAPFSKDFISN